ncbi:hypothetical protein ACFPTO_10545 [Paraburkholderia denitrificans]|uniref:Uncharacterized protein n=1 Tax=Paraburkholderia denitrificans TaxID=694025 RepID=A0ABW0J843_9BURK
MEETGATIHSGLTRRNNFLRENPQSCRFVAAALETAPKCRIDIYTPYIGTDDRG